MPESAAERQDANEAYNRLTIADMNSLCPEVCTLFVLSSNFLLLYSSYCLHMSFIYQHRHIVRYSHCRLTGSSFCAAARIPLVTTPQYWWPALLTSHDCQLLSRNHKTGKSPPPSRCNPIAVCMWQCTRAIATITEHSTTISSGTSSTSTSMHYQHRTEKLKANMSLQQKVLY